MMILVNTRTPWPSNIESLFIRALVLLLLLLFLKSVFLKNNFFNVFILKIIFKK
jgi:hypothetical protein